ncbi:MAG: hypothetical protein C5B49_09925 [Bdellovibrio sp.]|nr:MAG: hypothetical protein C5B49_09925 [Bdellovibrio sp.]
MWVIFTMSILPTETEGAAPGRTSCTAEPTSEAKQSFDGCMKDVEGNPDGAKVMSSAPANAIIFNFDSKCMWIIDRKTGQSHGFYNTQVGQGGGCGNEGGSNKTPCGLVFTCEKTYSGVFGTPKKFLGLCGGQKSTSETFTRGVLMHASGGPTHGCLGVDGGKFPEVKEKLVSTAGDGGAKKNANDVPNNVPIYVWSSSMKSKDCKDFKLERGDAAGQFLQRRQIHHSGESSTEGKQQ